jgi:hypothetical protein
MFDPKLSTHKRARAMRFRQARRFRSAIEALEDRRMLAIATTGIPDWLEQGPMDIKNNLAAIPAQENPSVGAIKAVAQHPTDGNIIYVATVNGGVWRTTNGLSSNPVWSALTDHFPSLAMGDIAFSPLDPTGGTLFAAHAHTSALNSDTSPLLGLLKTTDGGASWLQVGTDSLSGKEIASVVPAALSEPTGQVILVATLTDGVHRSADGGNTFQRISGALIPRTSPPTLRLPLGAATELIADPADPNRYYVALSAHPAGGATSAVSRGVYRSTDGGLTWQRMDIGITGLSTSLRIRLAVHYDPISGAHAVYAAVVNLVLRPGDAPNFPAGKPRLTGVFRSEDAGGTWSVIGTAPDIHPGGQGDKDLSLVADARDADVVYIGGDRGAGNLGNLSRGNAATGAWRSIVGARASGTVPHPDSRDMEYVTGGTPDQDYILDVNDGGIYKLTNPGSSGREWVSLNGNLRPTEMIWGTLDTLNHVFSGGTWDNGDIEQTRPPVSSTVRWDNICSCGDGGYHMVDNSSAFRTVRYRLADSLSNLRRRVAETALPVREEVPALSGVAGGDSDGNMIDDDLEGAARIALNAINPSWMLIQAKNNLYVSTDRGDSVSVVFPTSDIGPDAVGGGVSAIAFGGRFGGFSLPNVAYVGFNTSFYQIDIGAPSFTRLDGPTGRYPGQAPGDIVVDPENVATVFVFTANADASPRIWMGRNVGLGASETWVDITKNLNGFLVARRPGWSAFHKLEVARVGGRLVLLAAGQGGVYRLIDPADSSARWSEFGRGLANAEIFDLDYYPPTSIEGRQGDVLVASTMGRGIWTIPNASTYLATPSVLVITGDTDFSGQADFIRLERDATDPLRIRAFVNNFTFTPDYSVEWTAVDRILVDGLLGHDTVVVDFGEGNPVPVSGITVFGGGDFEEDQLIVLGTGLDDDIAINRSNLVIASATINYDGVKEVIVSGLGGQDNFNVESNSLAAQVLVRGGPGNDVLTFSASPFGGSPAEVFTAEFFGGEGHDRIEATVTGGVDLALTNDLLMRTDEDPPFLLGSRVFLGSVEDALLIGGPGNNLLDASAFTAGRVTLRGEDGDDHLIGGPNDDTLDGGPGDDTMDGGGGDDTYLEAPGSFDRLIDSAGFDTLDFSTARSGIALDLTRTAGEVQTVDVAGNQIALTGFFERVIGSAFDDRFFWGHTVAGQSILEMLAGAGDDQVIIDGTKALPGTAVSLIGQQGDDRFQIHLPLPGAGGNPPPNPPGGQGVFLSARIDGERLHIVGTDQADDIRIVARPDQTPEPCFDVGISDPVSQRLIAQITADSVGHFALDAAAGNDRITALLESAGLIAVPIVANLHGGAGDDQLFIDTQNNVSSFAWSVLADGGAGDDFLRTGGLTGAILLGGKGIDEVTGGSGRDLLIGGEDRDGVTGGKGEDIFIPGLTTFDANPDALRWIHGFWNSDLPFLERVEYLSGPSDAPFHLTFGESVFDDGADNNVSDHSLDDWLLSHCFVTNTNDSGPGSLREAINCANLAALPGQAAVVFRIPTTDPNFIDVDSHLPSGDPEPDAFIISLLSELPALDNEYGWGIVLDGRTQTSFGGDTNSFGPEIVLYGGGLGDLLPPIPKGLQLDSDDNRVIGLNLQGFGDGIYVTGSRNWVAGNYIGTDATGREVPHTAAVLLTGLEIRGSHNRIGTNGDNVADTAERNVISGHGFAGVALRGVSAHTNTVAGNFIGTDATGTAALGNFHGVAMLEGAWSNVVGTDGNGIADAAERNLASGNVFGIFILDAGTQHNIVAGNFIGTDITGGARLGNSLDGVAVFGGARLNRIGTNDDIIADGAERNIISTNGQNGIHIRDAGTEDNVVAGNYIGTDVTGTRPLGNGGHGVAIIGGAKSNRIGLVRGPSTGSEGNIISANGLNGVHIEGAGTDGNIVARNRIGTDRTGSRALGNGVDGVRIIELAAGNFIGFGAGPNLISGNSNEGIRIQNGASRNQVLRNLIGTDISGTRPLGNASDGVAIVEAPDNIIGGSRDGAGNVISANTLNGVAIQGSAATGNVVRGNLIGTDGRGTMPLGNGGYGVSVNVASNNVIGDARAGLGNIISANRAGVFVGSDVLAGESVGNHVRGNFIGVDITGAAPLPNGTNGVEIVNRARQNFVGTDADGVDDHDEGNIISANPGDGVLIRDAQGNSVAGNYIGTDVTGLVGLGNGRRGVFIQRGADNLVGGTTFTARNVISANADDGVQIQGPGTTGNRIQGNFVGTDVRGLAALPNRENGVTIVEAAGNLIGGATPGALNLISGNAFSGVVLFRGAVGNVVQGNRIGTDVDGIVVLANGASGVLVREARENVVGTDGDGVADAVEANLIKGNRGDGVTIQNADNNIVAGNSIFLNAGHGVHIFAGAAANRIGTDGASVAADSVEGNLIAFNMLDGVRVVGAETVRNTIRGNSIHSNGLLGIDLGGDGVTDNDALDPDTGPNQLQNYPKLAAAVAEESGTRVRGTLQSLPGTSFRIDFYANAAADPSGYGEGQRWLGAITVTTNSGGTASFNHLIGIAVEPGQYITATATEGPAANLGNTSEFSAARVVIKRSDRAPGSQIVPAPEEYTAVAASGNVRLTYRIDRLKVPAQAADQLLGWDHEAGLLAQTLSLAKRPVPDSNTFALAADVLFAQLAVAEELASTDSLVRRFRMSFVAR